MLNILYAEESLRERLETVRRKFSQLENVAIFAQLPLDVPERPRRLYNAVSQSNRGDTIGPVSFVPWSATMSETAAEKKKILAGHRHEVGGPAEYDELLPLPKDAQGREPVFFHCMPETYYTMILQDFPIKATFDLTAGVGNAAVAHVKARIPYVGVVFNEVHLELVVNQVVDD
eukprot:3087845-Pyramimonas_sp.AAC.1